jgi:predicted GNAT family N-acyltransferase
MTLKIRQCASTDADFGICFDIRQKVFVDEQKVPIEEERDEYDAVGLHFLARLDGKPAGTARVLMQNGDVKITRVAVLKEYRGQRLGEALMRHIETELPAARRYILDGQIQARDFYTRLGYAPVGDVFLEAGIAHVRMVKDSGSLI